MFYLLILKAVIIILVIYGLFELLDVVLDRHFDYGKGSRKRRLF